MDYESFKGTSDEYYELVLSDPEWFLKHCQLGGFVFKVESGILKVSPANQIDDEMIALLITHKNGLIKLLTAT